MLERVVLDHAVSVAYLLLIIPSIYIHFRISKLFPWFKLQCFFLSIALVALCVCKRLHAIYALTINLVTAAKYQLDAFMVRTDTCTFFITILYSVLWDGGTFLLIAIYILHLLLW